MRNLGLNPLRINRAKDTDIHGTIFLPSYPTARRQKLTFVVLGAAWFICAALQIGMAESGETPSVVWTTLDILGFVVIYFVVRTVIRCMRVSRDLIRRVFNTEQ